MDIENFVQLLLLLAIVFNASIAWFVLLKKPSSTVNRVYFFMIFWTTVWLFSNYLVVYVNPNNEFESLILARSQYAGALLFIPSVIYFVLIFARQKLTLLVHIMCVTINITSFFFIVTTQAVVVGVSRVNSELIVEIGWIGNLLPVVFTILIALLFVTITVVILDEADQRRRIQMQYIALGILIPVIFGFVNNILNAFGAFNKTLETPIVLDVFSSLGASSTILFSFIIAWSMLRHKLLDVRLVLKRHLLSGLVFALLLITGASILWKLNVLSVGVVVVVFIGLILFFFTDTFDRRVFGKVVRKRKIYTAALTDIEQESMLRLESTKALTDLVHNEIHRQFNASVVSLVTYNHIDEVYEVMHTDGTKSLFDLHDLWLELLVRRKEVVYSVEKIMNDTKISGTKALNKVMAKLNATHVISLKQNDERLIGILFINCNKIRTIEGKNFTQYSIERSHQWSMLLWGVLQMKYAAQLSIK